MSAAIIAIGEPMLEFNQVRDADGETRYLPGFGGDTSNFAVAAARQGASVAYFTRLGADAFGDAFVDLWREEGIDTSLIVRDADSPTGIVFVTHSQAGHAFIYYRKDSAASRMVADVPAEAVAGDTFGGAFVAMLLAGKGLDEAARYANAAAALSTTGYGAVAPIPRRDQVERLLAGAA